MHGLPYKPFSLWRNIHPVRGFREDPVSDRKGEGNQEEKKEKYEILKSRYLKVKEEVRNYNSFTCLPFKVQG